MVLRQFNDFVMQNYVMRNKNNANRFDKFTPLVLIVRWHSSIYLF